MTSDLMTAREVAAYLRISHTTLDRWLAAGQFPQPLVRDRAKHGRQLSGSVRMWRKVWLDDHLAQRTPKGQR